MRGLMAVVLLAWTGLAAASEWQEHEGMAAIFSDAGVRGTFVLYDVAAERYIGHDRARAEAAIVPASTFKIPNTLIGLSTGAVENLDEVLPYGGEPQPFEAWEHDLSLRDAFPVSSVPIYQALARRIGIDAMLEALARLDYGNAEVAESVDDFWLVGPLRISAMQQVRFLARLAQGALDFNPDHQAAVRQLAHVDTVDGHHLHAKTGWASTYDPDIGWWVGWVEHDDRLHAFALHIDIRQTSDLERRARIGRACLAAAGVFPAP
jgi:beta-lactamase class D OXA-50